MPPAVGLEVDWQPPGLTGRQWSRVQSGPALPGDVGDGHRSLTKNDMSGTDLNDVLFAVQKAAPVDAVQAVTRSIGVILGPSWVSFLVADMSGRALVRLVHVPIGAVSGGVGRRRTSRW